MGQFFASGGQSIRASASALVLPINIQDWFPWGLTGLISLQSKELSRVSSNTTVQKYQFFSAQLSLWSNSHIHTWLLEKPWLWQDGPGYSFFFFFSLSCTMPYRLCSHTVSLPWLRDGCPVTPRATFFRIHIQQRGVRLFPPATLAWSLRFALMELAEIICTILIDECGLGRLGEAWNERLAQARSPTPPLELQLRGSFFAVGRLRVGLLSPKEKLGYCCQKKRGNATCNGLL